MRTLAVLLVAVATAAPSNAQEVDTVLGPDTESYFYAAAVAKLSEVDSELATYLGFNLGWVFDEKFSIGLGIYGLAHPTLTNSRAESEAISSSSPAGTLQALPRKLRK